MIGHELDPALQDVMSKARTDFQLTRGKAGVEVLGGNVRSVPGPMKHCQQAQVCRPFPVYDTLAAKPAGSLRAHITCHIPQLYPTAMSALLNIKRVRHLESGVRRG